eukprot:snap_masked-scaffold_8-processed-gene-2.34-mRNA-1 protein AED:1.00 eAED:1.00 QI:0/-1/0/0/-1/1/1/0/182
MKVSVLALFTLYGQGFAQDFDQKSSTCAAILCPEGSECVEEPLVNETGCYPVSCESPDACEEFEICVPHEKLCVTQPCPQFFCTDDCVICPQVVPECEYWCLDCEVVLQTCETCSYGLCLDYNNTPPDIITDCFYTWPLLICILSLSGFLLCLMIIYWRKTVNKKRKLKERKNIEIKIKEFL